MQSKVEQHWPIVASGRLICAIPKHARSSFNKLKLETMEHPTKEHPTKKNQLSTQKEATVLPSHLLGDAQWLDYTNRLFGVENLVADISVNDEMKERGDMLAGMLRDCLKTVIRRRVQSEGKRKHWAFELASKDLSAVAAHMVLVDHEGTICSLWMTLNTS
jgi:hypothetical protein